MSTSAVRERAATPQPGALSRNRIIESLPREEQALLAGEGRTVTIKSGDTIHGPGEDITRVFFPHDSIVSLVTTMSDGGSVEALTVGNDGFTGLSIFHGLSATTSLAIGQVTGAALELTPKVFSALLPRTPFLRRQLHRYSQFAFEMVSQSAACNRLHVIEQRCARWLLMTQDRVGRDRFDLTQVFLSEMLGVRRPGVTVAMGILEKQGLIGHSRASVSIVNREGLEAAACECYQSLRDRQRRILAS